MHIKLANWKWAVHLAHRSDKRRTKRLLEWRRTPRRRQRALDDTTDKTRKYLGKPLLSNGLNCSSF